MNSQNKNPCLECTRVDACYSRAIAAGEYELSCDEKVTYNAELDAKREARRAKLAATKALKPRVKPIKHELICYVLYKNGPVMGRVKIMETIHVLECSKLPFKPTSNHDYFKNVPPGFDKDYDKTFYVASAPQSVITRGLVVPVWSEKGRKIVGYKLTEAGIELAKKTEELFFSGVISQET